MNENKKLFKPSGDVFLERLGEESMLYIKTVADDVAEMMIVAKKLAMHTNKFETKVTKGTEDLYKHIEKLEKEVADLKERI